MAEAEFPEGFMDAAAKLAGLPVAAVHAAGVRMNLERIAQVAALLLAVSIPDDVEAATVFEPAGFES